MSASFRQPPKYPEATRCRECGAEAASTVCNICGHDKVLHPDNNTTYARLRARDDQPFRESPIPPAEREA